MDSTGDKASMIKELHGDLSRKYQIHGPRIEQIWRSFDRSQRAEALKVGAADGVVLKDPKDRSMGNVYKVMPEWNLRDITEPESDFLLDYLKHRASKSLFEQYCEGVNGSPGDHGFITNSMCIHNLRHVDPFKNCFSLFMDDDKYGQSFKVTDQAHIRETMAALSPAVNARLCVPQSTGELILERQLYTLSALNILVEDILDIGSTSRSTNTRTKKPEEAARTALSKLSIAPKPKELSFPDLLSSALDQKSSLEDYLRLCYTEPVVLAHAVNIWHFTRPELVPDEKGRTMPLITDKYISTAVFEMINNAVIGAAIWGYLHRLLLLVDEATDKVSRAIVLQEISNIVHLEYKRVQKTFKRYVQIGSGKKYFKRISGVYDNGMARVVLKGDPEVLTRRDPQLSYMLRLCAAETDASRAVTWIKKIDDLHQSHPTERDNMEEHELESFSDLAVITSFVQSLSTLLPLPQINRKKGQIYVSRSKALAAELDTLKTQVDLANFAVPIDNLLEPGMAEGALAALDQFIMEKTGAKLGFLYLDLIEECVSMIQDYCQQQKAQIGPKAKTELSPPPFNETLSQEVRVQQRRQKAKTRPAHSSIFDATPTTSPTQPEIGETQPIFRVKQATAEVFSTLFSRSESRGSISWAAFEAAMANLKFSVVPKFGSVFTFFPPEDMGVQKSLTVHRPHKSQIEGHVLLIFASRLSRVYGWGEQSFEVA